MTTKRIIIEDGIYHIIQKGVEDRDIFLDIEDYKFYLKELKEGLNIYQISLLSYALLKNHLHLLVKIKDKNLSSFMHKINNNYAHYFNDKYFRRGHLFASRYKSILVKDDAHFLTLIRYINLNPFSNFEREKYNYRWCSYNEIIKHKSNLMDIGELKELLSIKFDELIKYINESKINENNIYSDLKSNNTNFNTEEIRIKILKMKEKLDENSIRNFYYALIYFLHNNGMSFREISSILNFSHVYIFKVYKKCEKMILKDIEFINWVNNVDKILKE